MEHESARFNMCTCALDMFPEFIPPRLHTGEASLPRKNLSGTGEVR
jgi:hypothetical protein